MQKDNEKRREQIRKKKYEEETHFLFDKIDI